MEFLHIRKRYSSNKSIIQFTKYVLVGGTNFITSFGLFLLLYSLLGINYLIVTTLTWIYGILLTYVLNFIWVFKPSEKLEFKKRFPKYFSVYLTSYIINIIILSYLVEKYDLSPIYTQFAIIPLIVLINFFGFKYWSLRSS